MINFNKMEFSFKFIILLIFLIQAYESHKFFNITYEKLKAEIIEIKDYKETIKSYQLSDFCKNEIDNFLFMDSISCNSININFNQNKTNSNYINRKVLIGEKNDKTIGIIYVSVNFYFKLDPKFITKCAKKFGKNVCKKIAIPSSLTIGSLNQVLLEMYQKVYLQLIKMLPYNQHQNLYNNVKKTFVNHTLKNNSK